MIERQLRAILKRTEEEFQGGGYRVRATTINGAVHIGPHGPIFESSLPIYEAPQGGPTYVDIAAIQSVRFVE